MSTKFDQLFQRSLMEILCPTPPAPEPPDTRTLEEKIRDLEAQVERLERKIPDPREYGNYDDGRTGR